MKHRQQERNGWIFGWLGGFVWVPVLSIVSLIQGRSSAAVMGLVITVVALVAVLTLSPWRYPEQTYRRLMAPLYAIFLLSVIWAGWSFGNLREIGINSGWSLLLLFPVLLPVWLVGARRWQDGER